jgi:iron complex transport system substrate-binding protein
VAAGVIAGPAFAPPFAAARPFTGSGGRKISVPDEVHRVFPAGPPASVTLFTVAPEKMLGWSRAPSPEARSFLPARYAELPEIGRLTGRGNTVNLENVVRLAPDLVLDVGSTAAAYVSLADQVQERPDILAVLIGGPMAGTPTTLRTIGDLLGVSARANALAGYAETALDRVQEAFSRLDDPPAPNRLIGLLWLGKLLYPACFPQDIRAEARRFYALFYQQEPSEVQLERLLADRAQIGLNRRRKTRREGSHPTWRRCE